MMAHSVPHIDFYGAKLIVDSTTHSPLYKRNDSLGIIFVGIFVGAWKMPTKTEYQPKQTFCNGRCLLLARISLLFINGATI